MNNIIGDVAWGNFRDVFSIGVTSSNPQVFYQRGRAT